MFTCLLKIWLILFYNKLGGFLECILTTRSLSDREMIRKAFLLFCRYLYFLSKFLLHLLIYCVCICVCIRTTFGGLFSPSTMWALGIRLSPSMTVAPIWGAIFSACLSLYLLEDFCLFFPLKMYSFTLNFFLSVCVHLFVLVWFGFPDRVSVCSPGCTELAL